MIADIIIRLVGVAFVGALLFLAYQSGGWRGVAVMLVFLTAIVAILWAMAASMARVICRRR